MGPLVETIKLNLKIFFVYRWAFFISVIIDPLLIIVYICIFRSLYQSTPEGLIVGYTFPQMIWYFAASRFFISLVWSYPDSEIASEVLLGNLPLRMIKPVSVLKIQLGKSIAYKIFGFFFEFLPSFAIYLFLVFPDFLTVACLVKYLVVMGFSFFLLFLLGYLIGISAIFLKSITALLGLKISIVIFMAGTFLPIDFFPGIIQSIIKMLPFQLMFYVPTRILLNMPETGTAQFFLTTIFSQTAWILVFYLVGKFFWRFALRQYTAEGC